MLGVEGCGNLMLGGGAEAESVEFELALCQFVRDAVGASVQVTYLRRPQSANDLPCLVVEKTGESRDDCLDSPARSATRSFEFTVWSLEPNDIPRIARQVRDLFGACRARPNGFQGMILGHKVHSSWLDEGSEHDIPEPPDDGSDEWLYGRVAGYSMIVDVQ